MSYQRFVALRPSVLIPLCVYFQQRQGQATGLAFIDATSIAVCHNRRIYSHKVFKKIAQRGKTSRGWFYGFKLHRVVNDGGELLAFRLTPGHGDDRRPVPPLTQTLSGKLFGDKGYLSKRLFQTRFEEGLPRITPIRKNRHNRLLPLFDKLVLRKRALIDPLKNISPIEHTRYRRVANFMVNLLAGLMAYTHQPLKPSLNLTNHQQTLLSKNPCSYPEFTLFFIFEPPTEWISKGKAGVPVEWGLKVCILEDQHQFILHHHVMTRQTDAQIAVAMIAETKKRFPTLNACSFDKGFHSPANQAELSQQLDQLTLPKKGQLSKARQAVEQGKEFVKARRAHSAVESAINALEVHGLDKCPDHGIDGFKRYVALAIVTRNIRRIGDILWQQEVELARKARERNLKYRQTADLLR